LEENKHQSVDKKNQQQWRWRSIRIGILKDIDEESQITMIGESVLEES
jgi:hypothetical protein